MNGRAYTRKGNAAGGFYCSIVYLKRCFGGVRLGGVAGRGGEMEEDQVRPVHAERPTQSGTDRCPEVYSIHVYIVYNKEKMPRQTNLIEYFVKRK